MSTPILVTGGAGTLGRFVVPRLLDVGHTVRILGRSSRTPDEGVSYVTGGCGLARFPVVPVPGLRLQPVDADEVAARLAELTLGEPLGRVADLAGPQVRGMDDLTRAYLTATGRHRLTVPIRVPGKTGRGYRSGDNLSLDDGTELGKRTWEDFLADRLSSGQLLG